MSRLPNSTSKYKHKVGGAAENFVRQLQLPNIFKLAETSRVLTSASPKQQQRPKPSCNRLPKLQFQVCASLENNHLATSKEALLCVRNPSATHSSLLRSLRNGKASQQTKLVVKNGSEGKSQLAELRMFAKSGALEDASILFGNMQQRNVASWNLMLRAHARLGQGLIALKFFDQMQQEGVLPDRITVACILSACAVEAAVVEGKQIHARIACVLELDAVVGTALVNMYGKCRSLEDAVRIFEELPERDVVTWNALITAYIQHGKSKKALNLFEEMQQEGLTPSKVTFLSLLDACSSEGMLAKGKWLHLHIVDSGCERDVTVGTALVNMYNRCGSTQDAIELFKTMPSRDVVAWTTIIMIYVQIGRSKEAFENFDHMQREGVQPNKITCVCILSACANHNALVEGQEIHVHVVERALTSHITIGNALINMYGNCGSVQDACRVFDKMLKRDVVSWTAIIAAHTQLGLAKKALRLFDQMQQEGVQPNQMTFVGILDACSSPAMLTEGERMHACILESRIELDIILWNALVNMYGKCGSVGTAQMVFDKMPTWDVISWTSMIAVYTQHGQGKKALRLFNQMSQQGVIPDKVTVVGVLDACASQVAIFEGKRIHVLILSTGFESDVVVGTALINMYSKCGSLENVQNVFDGLPQQDVVLWNALITGYTQHGLAKEALHLFFEMLPTGVMPDKVTFLGILGACSHFGLVEKGWYYFASMSQDYGISPAVEHCVCMIDLLGRAGLLDEAENLVNAMPFQPTAVSLLALLGACQYQMDVDRGERVARHVFELDPENAAPYILLSNIYAAAGKEDAAGMHNEDQGSEEGIGPVYD